MQKIAVVFEKGKAGQLKPLSPALLIHPLLEASATDLAGVIRVQNTLQNEWGRFREYRVYK